MVPTKNQMAINANNQHAFDVTFTFKAGTSQNDTNGSYPNLTLKYVMGENQQGNIDGLSNAQNICSVRKSLLVHQPRCTEDIRFSCDSRCNSCTW